MFILIMIRYPGRRRTYGRIRQISCDFTKRNSEIGFRAPVPIDFRQIPESRPYQRIRLSFPKRFRFAVPVSLNDDRIQASSG